MTALLRMHVLVRLPSLLSPLLSLRALSLLQSRLGHRLLQSRLGHRQQSVHLHQIYNAVLAPVPSWSLPQRAKCQRRHVEFSKSLKKMTYMLQIPLQKSSDVVIHSHGAPLTQIHELQSGAWQVINETRSSVRNSDDLCL